MAVTNVNTSTFVKDATLFIRDILKTNVTDPILSKRASGEKFVMTSYPKINVTYPIITIQMSDFSSPQRLGMQSTYHYFTLTMEARIWAKDVSQRDDLSQDVENELRKIEFLATGTVLANLYAFSVVSATNVDEDDGEASTRSRVLTIEYKTVLGG